MRRLALGLAFAASLRLLTGCAGESTVVRVYDGRIVEGPFVPPEAYSAYLRGVLAEEAGDLRAALAAYETAAQEDDEDPEPLSRIGDLRCRLDRGDKAADEAIDRALKIDREYAPARAARARCAALRGRPAEGIAEIERLGPSDRGAVSLEALFVRLAASLPPSPDDRDHEERARERAIALTVASGEHVAAWEALVAWGRARSDAELLARGLEGLVRVAPLRSREVEAGALELFGSGEAALARRVAGAIADMRDEQGVRRVYDPTAARLAVDDAIRRRDADAVLRRAARGHVPLAEVAARALVLERLPLAEELARNVAAADPGSSAARMLLYAIAARGDVPGRGKGVELVLAPTDRPPALCALVMADRLALAGGAEAARSWLAAVAPSALPRRDPVAGPIAVDLAARGVLPESALPPELRLELAARRREPPARANGNETAFDARHALLWHALQDPASPETARLLGRMKGAADRDPIVSFALARVALGTPSASRVALGTPSASRVALGTPREALAGGAAPSASALSAAARAVAAWPSDPLLLAVAVDIAKRAGKADELPPARARLMAVARTPAEHALATE